MRLTLRSLSRCGEGSTVSRSRVMRTERKKTRSEKHKLKMMQNEEDNADGDGK